MNPYDGLLRCMMQLPDTPRPATPPLSVVAAPAPDCPVRYSRYLGTRILYRDGARLERKRWSHANFDFIELIRKNGNVYTRLRDYRGDYVFPACHVRDANGVLMTGYEHREAA